MSDFVNSVTAAQINLSDDAPWKKIQKNTFTRWCNEHLRCVDKQINDLRFDLSDGLNLISLLEVLSHKRMFRKFHARPTLRQLKLDNVSVALEFLDREKIKLVSIDSKAIVDGNLKLILGLVWTLILHYSISIPVWEDEASDTVTKLTPEMKLLGWIQSKVPELPITNFSQDWQDGKALGALVDGLAPGLCPDWESWNAVQRVTNTREAMQQADDWLGVPQLIAPEEILDPGVDERSVMTYLSLFPKAKLKPGAPLKPKIVPKPKACRATGRGLQARGLRVGQLADFKVDTHKAGPGNLAVHIREPTGNEVAVKQREVLEGIYGFEYMPGDEGDYTVDITWANKHIPKSPFKVHVGPKAGQQKIRAWGPGLEGGTVGMPASFLVEASGVVAGMLGFAIEGPSQAKIECDDKNDGSCFVRFWPTEAGEYAVHVMCDDEEIEDSPFMACIAPKKKSFSPDKVKVYGAGVSPAGVLMNCQAEFTVDATQAGEGVLKIFIQTLEGSCIKVDVICEEAGIYNCSYTPTTICKHSIVVSWGGVSVPGSPFAVMPHKIKIEPCTGSWSPGSEINYFDEEMDTDQVTEVNMKAGKGSRLDIDVVSPLDFPTNATKVKAYGPGLRGGLLGQRAEFTIDTREAGSGRLTVTMEGPCQVTLQCMDNEDGTCAVFYLPAEHGEHTIRIFFDNSQIPGSPFLPVVHLPLDPSKVTVSGPGLTKGKVGEPCMVNIDCALAGSGDLSVEAVSDSGAIAKTEVQENKDGSYTVVYVPLTAGVYTLLLKYGGQVVPIFPAGIVVEPAVYKSHVKLTGQGDLANAAGNCDPSQVLADGLGLFQGLAGHPNKCYINTRGAGNGHLEVTIDGPSESKVSCKDNEDGSYTMEYIPSAAGQYDINITYGEKSIPGSPFKVTVKDVSATSAEIAGPRICAQSSQNFTFDSKKTGNIPETVTVISPQGKSELMDLKDNGDGTYTVNFSPSVEGPHSLMVRYAEDDSFCSHVNFHVLQRPAAGGEKAKNQSPRREMNISGEGLESGMCNKTPQSFTISCSATGKAPETVAIAKPDGTVEVLELTDNGDGTYTVTCSPTTGGSHLLAVKYTDEEAFSSPYEFHVLDAEYPLQSIVTAPGLVSGICTQTPQVFTIDCREHGKLPTSITMMNSKGLIELLGVEDNGDGTCTVSYSPSVEGPHSLMVKYGDDTAFSSPFKFQVLPKHDGSFAQDCRSKKDKHGPGLEGKYCAKTPQNFTIGCSSAGAAPETVVIVNPGGSVDLAEATDNGDGTYSVVYCPYIDGLHSLEVKYTDEDAFSSAFKFHVLPTDDMTNVKISAPEVESRICTQRFAPTGKVPQSSVAITPKGLMNVGVTEMMVDESSVDETFVVSCLPTTTDPHSLMMRYAEDNPNSSPCSFQVLPKPDASESKISRIVDISGQDMAGWSAKPESKVKFSGTGMKSVLCSQAPQTFTIDCSTTGETLKSVAIVTPNGKTELVEVKDNGNGTYTVNFSPSVEGPHSIMVKNAEDESLSRAFKFQVLPVLEAGDQNMPIQDLKVSGQELMGAIYQNIPQTFTIDCNNTGEVPEIAVVVKPDGTIDLLKVHDNGDGTCTAAYAPSMEGSYSFVLKYAKEESFCRAIGFQVLPTEKTQIKVTGPGLESGIHAQQPQMFTIDCSLTGVPEGVAIICPNGTTEMLQAKDHEDGTYSVSFFPCMEGPHGLLVKIAGEDKYCNPLGFQVLSAEAVKEVQVSGPGLDSGICSQSPQTFVIDCRKTGDTPQVISILTPYGLMEQLEVKNNGDGTYIVNYSPSVDGVHSLMVKHVTDDSYCSPFRFYVLPSTNADTDHDLVEELKKKTGIYGPSLESEICARTPQTFTIDCSSTGEAPETVAVVKPDGTVKLVDISDNGDETYSAAYSPVVEGSHFLMVKYTDEDAFRSPYEFQVIPKDDKEEMKIYGLGLESGICSQVPQTFRINSSQTGKPPETVVLMTPNGETELVDIKDNGDGTYRVNCSHSVEGPHSLMVKYADDESFISSSKFHVLPTNKQKGGIEEQRDIIEISDQKLNPRIHIEISHTFALKCSSTGAAPETAAVVKPDGTIDLLKVLDNADGTYHVTYTPSEEGAHSLVVRHAGEEAFCSPTVFNVLPQHDLTTETALDSKVLGRELTPLGFTNQAGLMMFDMVMQLGEGEISGKVIMPSGMTAQLDIIESGDGTITLKFSPTEEGLHHVLIKSCAADIPELSLQYYVNSSMNRCVKAHGRGLVYGVTHETAAFTIYHEDTAIGELDITVEGASESEVCCFDNKDGTCTVTYLPTQPGEYKIHVRHNDMHISGSPFKAKITDGSLRKSQVKLGTAVDFALDITEEDISLLTASISSPTRQDVPCSLKRQPDSHIGISFIPREVGDHLVSIKKDGKHVRSSPIPVCINLSDIGDASKVKVFGPGLHSGRTNHISEFVVNTRDAGYGGLTVAIEGPTNVVIHTEELEDGACRISYCPSKPGTYKVFIRFSDVHVQGSPFLAEVSDGELMRQSITHYQKPPLTANIGKECSLTFKISGIDMETMAAKVSAPSGMAAEAMVTATDRDTYAVSFVPEEMGVYSVSMKSRGQEIEGSPLQYTVGPLGEGGAAKVQMWGQGLHGAHAKIPADFNIWAREAGEGSLCVSVEGPGHTELHLDDHKDGSCSVSYTVEEPGNYQVSILFNEQHISASPFLVSVNALTENSEYSLEGLERHKATDHGLMSSGCAESLQPGSSLNSTCTCSAESILLSNVSEITSHGPGLSEASIGQKNTFYVDCSKAGRNMLFVGMLGPTVPCERVTVRHLGKNQYSINYTLKERGKYILAVKWGDEHIPGSPFHINVL
ncbi:filamin-B [Pygocentrus nattereri]|uniref:filamin-B n=1 Tax=Pygocentrus nattereri TaxID=42514 RepID=UPI001890C3D1|nr:filamin-B [Pygocentrus nattereri]